MLVPLDDARRYVLARVPGPVPVETVLPADAVGRVAAERIVSPEAVPPFDNAGMDGCAQLRSRRPGRRSRGRARRARSRRRILAGQAPTADLGGVARSES